MLSLAGKQVFISGASRGLGRLVALFMARQGCNLVLHSRDLRHTKTVLEQVADIGVQAIAVQADLADPSQVSTMLDQLQQQVSAIDIVFNNAGFQVTYRQDFWHTPTEDFQSSFQVNCIVPAMICYRLIPPMIERGFGRVINVTSGIRNEPEQAGYSASKAALDKFTRDLGNKLDGSNVMINLVDPGWCRTDLGGPMAPSAPESSLPGMVVGAFLNDGKSGRLFRATEFTGLSLHQALKQAQLSS